MPLKKSARISTRTIQMMPSKVVNDLAAPLPYSTSLPPSSPNLTSPVESSSLPNSPSQKTSDNAKEDSQNNSEMLGSPITLSADTHQRSESPAWSVDPTSLIACCMVDGTYPKMLNVLETWKTDPAVLGRVAAFMEYSVNVKSMPGNFGQHLIYRKNSDTLLHIIFFGEIAPTSYGTALGAKGNHYVGTSGNVSLFSFEYTCILSDYVAAEV